MPYYFSSGTRSPVLFPYEIFPVHAALNYFNPKNAITAGTSEKKLYRVATSPLMMSKRQPRKYAATVSCRRLTKVVKIRIFFTKPRNFFANAFSGLTISIPSKQVLFPWLIE